MGRRLTVAVIVLVFVLLSPWLLVEVLYQCVLLTVSGRPQKTEYVAPKLAAGALWASLEDGPPEMRPWTLSRYVRRESHSGSRVAFNIARDYVYQADLQRSWLQSRVPLWRGGIRAKWTVAALGRWVSRHWTADEALSWWAASAYFGHEQHGLESASAYYFGKPASQLTADEAALLAAVHYSHYSYDPACRPDSAKQMRDRILDRMQQAGIVDSSSASSAQSRPVVVRVGCEPSKAITTPAS